MMGLLSLPDTIIHTIFSHLSWSERRRLLRVSHSCWRLLSSPDFLLQLISDESDEEVLCFVGGQHLAGRSGRRRRRNETGQRMELKDNVQLHAYFPSLSEWRILPSSPLCQILDTKPLFVPSPAPTLLLLGGFDLRTGVVLRQVIGFGFSNGRWTNWPDMPLARSGEDFHAVFVDRQIVLFGCDDCDSPPPTTNHESFPTAAGSVHIFDLDTRLWRTSRERSPMCPPVDGGVAVIRDRYVCFPGTSNSFMLHDAALTIHDGQEDDDVAQWRNTRRFENGYAMDTETDDEDEHDEEEEKYNNFCTSDDDDEGSKDEDMHYAPFANPVKNMERKPGLFYDTYTETFHPLPFYRNPSTLSPTTVAYHDQLLVMGGYDTSSLTTRALHDEGLTLNYEEHVDDCWTFDINDCLSSVNSATMQPQEHQYGEPVGTTGQKNATKREGDAPTNATNAYNRVIMPEKIPDSLRGASALIYNDRLTLLGGLSSFSPSSDNDTTRRTIWQFFSENNHDDKKKGVWRPMTVTMTKCKLERNAGKTTANGGCHCSMEDDGLVAGNHNDCCLLHELSRQVILLPIQGLLDGYAFSVRL